MNLSNKIIEIQNFYKNLFFELCNNENNLSDKIISKCSLSKFNLKCSLCDKCKFTFTFKTLYKTYDPILYKYNKWIICDKCLNSIKKIRIFDKVIYNNDNNLICANSINDNITIHTNSKFYKYHNDMILCELCYDNSKSFKQTFNNKFIKLFDNDDYFYILPNLILIKLININPFDIKYSTDIYNTINHNTDTNYNIYHIDNILSGYFISNGIEIILNNIDIVTFNTNKLNNLFNLVQLFDYTYILPICSTDNNGNKLKNEYYIFMDLNNSSSTYLNLFILSKINGLYSLNFIDQTFLDYIKLKKIYTSNKYCLKCKNICNIQEHKTKLTIKSMAFEFFNQKN